MHAMAYLSKSAFDAHIGRSPTYMTWLNENGRLVLSLNSKQVDVLATEALIRDTADPSKAGVAARHQQSGFSEMFTAASQHEPSRLPWLRRRSWI